VSQSILTLAQTQPKCGKMIPYKNKQLILMLMSVSKLLPTTLTAQMLFMVSIKKKQTLKRFYKNAMLSTIC